MQQVLLIERLPTASRDVYKKSATFNKCQGKPNKGVCIQASFFFSFLI